MNVVVIISQKGEKRQPYEEDIRVPLIVRGPGIKPNSSTAALALNIDLAPTFLDLAGWPVPEDMDGQSLKPVLLGSEPPETNFQFLVEYFGEGHEGGCHSDGTVVPFLHDCINNTFLALRASDSRDGDVLFSDFFLTDNVPMQQSEIYFREFYNITQDNWEVQNAVTTLSDERVKVYEDIIWAFHECTGSSCHKMRESSRT
jgi:N-acetylglucosamine-6-sulfatase